MKTERRHELEANTLAKELNVWSEKLRPYTSLIMMGIAAVLGLYAVVSLWNTHSESRELAAWDSYQKALLQGDIDYRSVRRAADADDVAGTRMLEWAYMTVADRSLRRAAEDYLSDRESVKERLSSAALVYKQLSEDAADPDIKSRAQLGLARAYEMQNKLADAKKQYAAVQGVMQPVAEARLKELDTTSTAEATMKWLATAELPRPAAPAGGGATGVRPGFDSAPPATDSSTGPVGPTQSLDDIIKGGEGGRYGEGGAAGTGATDGAGTGATAPTTEGAGAAPATGAGTTAPAADPATTPAQGPAESAIMEPDAGGAAPAAK